MLKRLKSVSMLLFLMGASTGAAYAVANRVCCTTSLKEEYFLEQLALNY
ncbi:hypothetical protein [Phocaeicola dorei]|nr:hypothetical protein [Phocaeicola dorei]